MSLYPNVKGAGGLTHAGIERHAWTSTTKPQWNHP